LVECVIYCSQETYVVERLDEEGGSARLEDGCGRGTIFMAGYENNAGLRRSGAKMSEQFHSRHPLHPYVENGQRDEMVRDIFEKSFRLAEGLDSVTDRFQ